MKQSQEGDLHDISFPFTWTSQPHLQQPTAHIDLNSRLSGDISLPKQNQGHSGHHKNFGDLSNEFDWLFLGEFDGLSYLLEKIDRLFLYSFDDINEEVLIKI